MQPTMEHARVTTCMAELRMHAARVQPTLSLSDVNNSRSVALKPPHRACR